jgi:hypothetical protein
LKLTVAPKPTLVAQADFSRNLKPALAAKLFVFSDFSFALAFRKVLFVFFHLKVRSARHKVDFSFQVASQSLLRAAQSRLQFSSRISKSAPHSTNSTSVFKLRSKVRSVSIYSRLRSQLKSALTAQLLLELHGLTPNYYSESLQLGGCTQHTTRG